MSLSVDLPLLSGCMSMHAAPPKTPAPASPYAAAIELLRQVFNFPKEHSWIADFLFTSETLVVSDVVSGVQNAFAALVEMAFLSNIQSLQPESVEAQEIHTERIAAIPMFSKGELTVGVQVRKKSCSGTTQFSNSRFAYDNGKCRYLAVESPGGERIAVTFMTTSILEGRVIAILELHANGFRDLARKRKVSTALLLNVLMSCEVYTEVRVTCSLCGKGGGCECSLGTVLPSHPMDFARLAQNMVLFGGEFEVEKKIWRRNREGVLEKEPEERGRCRVGVGVDEKSVTKMCGWESTGIHDGDITPLGDLDVVHAVSSSCQDRLDKEWRTS